MKGKSDLVRHEVIDILTVECGWRAVQGGIAPCRPASWPEEFSPPGGSSKPVLYIPVKRRAGVTEFPGLEIHLALYEPGLTMNVQWGSDAPKVKASLKIFDALGGEDRIVPKEMEVVLNQCSVDGGLLIIEPGEVAKWLDENGDTLESKINDNLLDFTVEILDLPVQGTIYSRNRVFLYQKKVIVFIPGLYGTQFKVTGVDERGQDVTLAAWPDYRDIITGLGKQGTGVLECDSDGEPLLEAKSPALLRVDPVSFTDRKLKWFFMPMLLMAQNPLTAAGIYCAVKKTIRNYSLAQGYDVFHVCRKARIDRFEKRGGPASLPEVTVHEIWLLLYDWRRDLTECLEGSKGEGDGLIRTLKDIHSRLVEAPNTDDQLAVAGHSTGGLLLRGMLAHDEIKPSMISHAFFISVPFNGAPKALSMFLTGCDTPELNGDSGLPLNSDHVRAMAPTVPIIYHLAPNHRYPHRVAVIKRNQGDRGNPTWNDIGDGDPSMEAQKRSLVRAALAAGVYYIQKMVDARKASEEPMRLKLAKKADEWHEHWDAFCEWESARAAYEHETGDCRTNWLNREPKKDRDLELQDQSRIEVAWSDELARKAADFHQRTINGNLWNEWEGKSFVFYSRGHETTTRLLLEQLRDEVYERPRDLDPLEESTLYEMKELQYRNGYPQGRYDLGLARPGFFRTELEYARGREHWVYREGKIVKERWILAASKGDGDQVVPLESLLGFDGPVATHEEIPAKDQSKADTEHSKTANSSWLWNRIIEILGEDKAGKDR